MLPIGPRTGIIYSGLFKYHVLAGGIHIYVVIIIKNLDFFVGRRMGSGGEGGGIKVKTRWPSTYMGLFPL
jgi:hypothetical protein